MTEQLPSTDKKFPDWAKLVIGLAVAFFMFALIAGVGFVYFTRTMMKKVASNEKSGLQRMIEKGIENKIEKETGKKVDIHIGEDGLRVNDEKGEQKLVLGTGATLPQGFPDDVPIYQPSQIVSSADMAGMKMVSFQSNSTPQQIMAFYQSQLLDKGWKGSMNFSVDQQAQASVYTKDNQSLTVGIASAEDGKTGIILTYGKNNNL